MNDQHTPTTSLTDPNNAPFLFVAGVLALDFVNTEVIVRRKRRDLLNTPDAFSAWYATARQHYPELDAEPLEVSGVFSIACEFRAGLRHILETIVRQGRLTAHDLSPVNRVLREGYDQLAVSSTGTIVPYFTSVPASPQHIVLPIARSAYWLFTAAELDRLHQCRNPECILFFYDSTRSATRSWCSLGCMNRARSREQYRKRSEVASS